MKKLLTAMFVALLMAGCGEEAQKKAVQEEAKDDPSVPLLIPCVACGKEVSKKTEKCLGCGHPATDSVVAYKKEQEGRRIVEEPVGVEELIGAKAETEIISLIGGKSIAWPLGKEWTDPGWTASLEGEDMTAFVETVSFIDITEPGQYRAIYTLKDPETGEVVEIKERFVTVNQGGFVPDKD